MTAAPDHEIEPNDPTMSGPPVPADKGARLSQNEIEQLCLKAARGAGMSWGLAEEAGHAAAWLAMRGLDGPTALLAQLQQARGRTWRDICPTVLPGAFRPKEGGRLCPIALGAVLCDHARLPETAMGHTGLKVGPVDHPILLLPFLSHLARARSEDVRLIWPRGAVLVTGNGRVSGDVERLAGETAVGAELQTNDTAPDDAATPRPPLTVPAQTLRDLNHFALRTTVPASEASRAGAGSASGDND